MDEKIFPAPAVEVEDKSIKNFTDVPDASDINGTMKYWDEYRRKERERFAALNLVLDDNGVPLPGQGLAAHLDIREFPTEESLAKKALEEKQKAERAKLQIMLDTRKETTWTRLQKKVRSFISRL